MKGPQLLRLFFLQLIIPVSHLSLREWSLHVLQQTGQILLTVTHHQKQTETEKQTSRSTTTARVTNRDTQAAAL